jgi:hypothetical protein
VIQSVGDFKTGQAGLPMGKKKKRPEETALSPTVRIQTNYMIKQPGPEDTIEINKNKPTLEKKKKGQISNVFYISGKDTTPRTARTLVNLGYTSMLGIVHQYCS